MLATSSLAPRVVEAACVFSARKVLKMGVDYDMEVACA